MSSIRVAAVMALAGCGATSLGGAYTPPGFPVARLVRVPVDAPASFRAPIPTSIAGFSDGSWATGSAERARAAICHGDPGRRVEVLAALDAAAATSSPDDVAENYAPLFMCQEPSFYAWVLDSLPARTSPAASAVLWSALSTSDDPELRDRFENEAPELAAVTWYQGQASRPMWSPRLERALRKAVRAREVERASTLAEIVGSFDDRRASPLLVALHAEARDDAMRDALAIALYRRSEADARALVDDVCARATADDDQAQSRCKWHDNQGFLIPPDPETDPTDWVTSWSADPWAWVHEHPDRKASVEDALVTCISGTTDPDRSARATACVHELAELDRSRAATVIAGLATTDPVLTTDQALLARFADVDAMQAWLRELGMVDGTAITGRPPVTIVDALVAAGRGRLPLYDEEDGEDPQDLLEGMIALAGPELADVWVGEVPQRFDSEGAPIPGNQPALLAWFGGVRARGPGAAAGAGDPNAAPVAFLNALLQERQSPNRYASVPGSDAVVFGPIAGLIELDREGLLPLRR